MPKTQERERQRILRARPSGKPYNESLRSNRICAAPLHALSARTAKTSIAKRAEIVYIRYILFRISRRTIFFRSRRRLAFIIYQPVLWYVYVYIHISVSSIYDVLRKLSADIRAYTVHVDIDIYTHICTYNIYMYTRRGIHE